MGAGPDANRGNLQEVGDLFGQGSGDTLKHNAEDASILQGLRIVNEAFGGGVAAALDAIATKSMHRLRCEADMAHNGNSGLNDGAHGFSHSHAAFQLDRVGAAFLHQASRIAQGLGHGGLVGHEGQVSHQEGVVQASRDRPGVVDDILKGYWDGGLMALNDVAE